MKTPKFTQSLSFRLSLFVATVVLAGVCIVAGYFIFQDFQRTIEAEQSRLENTASAFAAASSAPLANGETGELYKVLRGISDVENSVFISARDANGAIAAEIGGSVTLNGRDGNVNDQSIWGVIAADTLSAESPIWADGQQIGSLTLHSDISWLRIQYRSHLIVMIVIALLSAIIIAALSNWVIARALKPLRLISGELVAMGENPDLSARFELNKNDEVGVLANAFNDAFATIQQRDKLIHDHLNTLEATVDQRTLELRIAADEARQANAAKSDFLATMSHEIRTPMNGMLVMAELLSASDLSSRQQRFAEVIARSGNSLLHIINDILDMSKIEAGKLELEQIPFSLRTLVEDTVSLYAARAHEKSLKIGMVIALEIADQFLGDPTRLGQILSNLTNNALKFTETGGVIIRVEAQETGGRNQKLSISVSDTGIGIAPEKLDTIFEAFSQADQTTTRNYGGTGLGLSISKRLTAAMDGEISASSVEFEGTTFKIEISLPVETFAEEPMKPARAYRVGVCDSSKIITQTTIESLRLAGIEAFDADDNMHNCDLMLLGGGSPNISPDVPVLLMSEYGDSGTNSQASIASIEVPLNHGDIQRIVASLNSDNWDEFDADSTAPEQKVQLEDFSSLNVLAVDDNAVNREVLNEALKALNVKAVFAEGGQEAVDLAAQQDFDIIFMDCSMPGMDGYQATAAIRKGAQSNDAYIVALTAHVTGPAAEQWKSAGMDNYVAKPFTVSQLSDVLNKIEAKGTTDAPDSDEKYPLLSPDVMSMFEMVSESTGNDMKSKVFSMFCEQVEASLVTLVEHYETGDDTQSLKELAHALKSMCSSAGALRAQMICEEVEQNAAADIWPDSALFEDLDKAIFDTQKTMKNAIQEDTITQAGDLERSL